MAIAIPVAVEAAIAASPAIASGIASATGFTISEIMAGLSTAQAGVSFIEKAFPKGKKIISSVFGGKARHSVGKYIKNLGTKKGISAFVSKDLPKAFGVLGKELKSGKIMDDVEGGLSTVEDLADKAGFSKAKEVTGALRSGVHGIHNILGSVHKFGSSIFG
jgi:hypothetical protein